MKPIENINLVYGRRTDEMQDADWLAAIRKVNSEINLLADLKGTSAKVDKRIAKLERHKLKIVAMYDAS